MCVCNMFTVDCFLGVAGRGAGLILYRHRWLSAEVDLWQEGALLVHACMGICLPHFPHMNWSLHQSYIYICMCAHAAGTTSEGVFPGRGSCGSLRGAPRTVQGEVRMLPAYIYVCMCKFLIRTCLLVIDFCVESRISSTLMRKPTIPLGITRRPRALLTLRSMARLLLLPHRRCLTLAPPPRPLAPLLWTRPRLDRRRWTALRPTSSCGAEAWVRSTRSLPQDELIFDSSQHKWNCALWVATHL